MNDKRGFELLVNFIEALGIEGGLTLSNHDD